MNHKMKVAEPIVIVNEILNFQNDGDIWETCHGLALVSQGKDRNLPIFKKAEVCQFLQCRFQGNVFCNILNTKYQEIYVWFEVQMKLELNFAGYEPEIFVLGC